MAAERAVPCARTIVRSFDKSSDRDATTGPAAGETLRAPVTVASVACRAAVRGALVPCGDVRQPVECTRRVDIDPDLSPAELQVRGNTVTTLDRSGAAPTWVWALLATLGMQTASAFLGRLVPTIAPVLTASTGLPEESIGYFAALSTVGSIAFLMIGHPLIRRYGPVRTLQGGLLLGGIGLVMLAGPHWSWVLLANVVLGVGYGPSAPAGSDILLRHSPAAHRTLIFSLKQAGVPMAGVLAGVLLP